MRARPRTTAAIALSIAMHLALGYAVGRVSWSGAEVERRPVRVVWIDDWPRADDGDAPVEETPRDHMPVNAPEAPEPRTESPPARTDAPAPEGASGADEPEPVDTEQATAPRIDWERERRNAVRQSLEAQAREDGRITFLPEELFEKPAAEPPNPREKMFDSPQRGPARAALTPGQGRSHFANRVAAFCHALTGGFGISFFGFGGIALCAEAGPGADFFADIRPAYMESLPVCVETRDPLLNPEGSNEFPTIKCRLVPKDELP